MRQLRSRRDNVIEDGAGALMQWIVQANLGTGTVMSVLRRSRLA